MRKKSSVLVFLTIILSWIYSQNQTKIPTLYSEEKPPQNNTVQSQNSGNQSISNFSQAKKKLPLVFKDMQYTFYCDCPYQNQQVDIAACHYRPLKPQEERSYRLEWEHIVPAHAFGKSFKEWRDGHPECIDHKYKPYRGRKCAQKVSAEFNRMEADLYNLVPAIGETNRIRSNLEYGILGDSYKNIFGVCNFKTDGQTVEPQENIRGIIARTYFYMNDSYKGRGVISQKNQKLFAAWDKMYPISEKEKIRAKRIESIQGNPNPFVF